MRYYSIAGNELYAKNTVMKGNKTMEDILSMLNTFYITPNIEDDELLDSLSALYRELTPRQTDLCERTQALCVNKAFLLGVRTGAELERFLKQPT